MQGGCQSEQNKNDAVDNLISRESNGLKSNIKMTEPLMNQKQRDAFQRSWACQARFFIKA